MKPFDFDYDFEFSELESMLRSNRYPRVSKEDMVSLRNYYVSKAVFWAVETAFEMGKLGLLKGDDG